MKINSAKSIRLEDFLNIVGDNLEERNVKIHFYTIEGSTIDFQGEISSFYSYLLVPFYDYDIESLDLKVDFEDGDIILDIYVKFDMKRFANMEWADKIEVK